MNQPHINQPDGVSETIAHEGVEQPINDNLGTANTQNDTIDDVLGDNINEGVTPIQRQNIDESRIDEVLVEDNLDDKDYPSIGDIADEDAVEHSFGDEL